MNNQETALEQELSQETALAHRDEAVALDAPRPKITIEEMMMKALEIGQPELIDKFVAIYEKREAESKKAAFDSAMARAQQRIQPVANNARNNHTGSNYAKLGAVNKAIAPIYGEEGLSIRFRPAPPEQPGHVKIIAVVAHENGYEEESPLEWPVDDKGAEGKVNKTTLHGIKSTTTYMQRTLVCLTFNVATEDDDDGNAGAGLAPRTVTEAQVKELQKLYTQLPERLQEVTLEHFTNVFKRSITSIADVPASCFKRAELQLDKAVERHNKAESREGLVTQEQAADLIAKIEEIGGSCKADFLRDNKIKTVSELPASQYQASLAALQQQRRG